MRSVIKSFVLLTLFGVLGLTSVQPMDKEEIKGLVEDVAEEVIQRFRTGATKDDQKELADIDYEEVKMSQKPLIEYLSAQEKDMDITRGEHTEALIASVPLLFDHVTKYTRRYPDQALKIAENLESNVNEMQAAFEAAREEPIEEEPVIEEPVIEEPVTEEPEIEEPVIEEPEIEEPEIEEPEIEEPVIEEPEIEEPVIEEPVIEEPVTVPELPPGMTSPPVVPKAPPGMTEPPVVPETPPGMTAPPETVEPITQSAYKELSQEEILKAEAAVRAILEEDDDA